MDKHTSGPWHFIEGLETKGQSVYVVGYVDHTGERTHDIRFLPPVSDWATAHANARLIAAAPDLLAACKLGLSLSPPVDQLGAAAKDVFNSLCAAIHKATGEAPTYKPL